MVLIAIAAVPLAMYARRPGQVEYPERSAWQALSERRMEKAKIKASKAAEIQAAKPADGRPPR